MNEAVHAEAQQLVDRLLGEDYASPEDFEKRPGGKEDPFRKAGFSKLKFGKGAFSGKRGTKPVKAASAAHQHPRFSLKFPKAD